MRIALTELRAAAETRAAGYLEEVTAAGVVSGDHVDIPAAAYARLFTKYRGAEVPVFEKHIAAAVTKYQSNCSTCGP